MYFLFSSYLLVVVIEGKNYNKDEGPMYVEYCLLPCRVRGSQAGMDLKQVAGGL